MCVIDAKESTIDIPVAFADMDDVVHMKLEGQMVDLMISIDPKAIYVQIENGIKVLYVVLKKALCGALNGRVAILEEINQCTEKRGFEVKPYDSCVMNKMIDRNQYTILWHVDNSKVSHVSHQVGMVDMFHSNMARLLSLCKRAHPDIQTSTSFLCTRIKSQTRMTTRISNVR